MKELNPHIRQIFQKYLVGKHTAQELDELLAYFGLPGESEYLKGLIEQQFEKAKPSPIIETELKDMVAEMQVNIHKAINPPVKIKRFKWWYAAAAVLFFFSIALSTYVVIDKKKETQILTSQYGDDVLPGGNRAYVTLSDGSRYELNETQTGITIDEDGIVYDNGSLIANTGKAIDATINVPRSGTYRITLSDGTKVILNSESSLQYPTNFTGPERKVQLIGEGYFDVAHNPKQPFIVATEGQELKVLGTHFNIQAYPGEKIASTLIEGIVELKANNNTVKLTPGHQAVLDNSKFSINTVNTDDYTGWMNQRFTFNDAPLSQIFSNLERWYDVSISYPSSIGENRYYMELKKDRNLSELLETISESTQLKFKIEGRRVTARQ